VDISSGKETNLETDAFEAGLYAPERFMIEGADASDSELIGRKHMSYWADAWLRLRKNKLAIIAICVLALLVVMVIAGPALSGYNFEETDTKNKFAAPSAEHWFGTDSMGRDVFARVWQGGRASIIIGFVAALVTALIGCLYGGASGFFGGKADTVMMRVVEILESIPFLITVILFSLLLQSKGLGTLLLVLIITGWAGTARLVRGQALQVRSQDYILAAKCLGVPQSRVIVRHLLPNLIGVVIVSVTFSVPGFIFAEAFLSFVGLGIQAPATSWGALASHARQYLRFYPHLMLFPSMMIALTMLSFTLLGDGLRDALDPRQRK